MNARPARRIRVRVPASTSNLGPGFDVLGMALKLHCELEVMETQGSALLHKPAVEVSGEGSELLPRDESNMVIRSFRSILPYPGLFHFRIKNAIPLGRGLGSSAAARLCGLLAAKALSGTGTLDSLLERACALEGHPDNVVPALYGGLHACLQTEKQVLHFQCKLPKDLGVVVCVPDFMVSTEKARMVLPRKIPLRDAVHTSSRVAFLIEALRTGCHGWLRSAMQDVLHQPYRKKLVRGLDNVIRAALDAGAYGAALSGSGSAVLALCLRGSRQAKVGRAMQKAFLKHGAESRYLALDIDTAGARVETR